MPGTKGFRYVYAGVQITKLLNKVQNTGRPDKLNFSYVRDTWLLKNEQYRAVLDLLEDMEFIDSSSVPTQLYAEYQNSSLAGRALAKGIRKAYPDLFRAYPSAQSLSKNELTGYFKQQTGKAGSVLEKMLSTFKTLCSLADFSAVPAEIAASEAPVSKKERVIHIPAETPPGPTVNINIQLTLPATDDETVYDRLFASLKRNFPRLS